MTIVSGGTIKENPSGTDAFLLRPWTLTAGKTKYLGIFGKDNLEEQNLQWWNLNINSIWKVKV